MNKNSTSKMSLNTHLDLVFIITFPNSCHRQPHCDISVTAIKL